MSSASSHASKPRRRPAFVPKVRGDLPEALADRQTFLTVAPSVPRSVAWLRDRTLAAGTGVTARDVSLFETLVAMTATGVETEDTIRAARLCSVERALTVLSAGGHDAQPRELVASLSRLFDRKPDPLKRSAMFHFHVPAWAIPLQQPGTRYAHLDLSVLSLFRRRSSPFLYREILAYIAANRLRYEPGQPPFVVSYAPADLASVLGMPAPADGAPPHVGQLRLRYLDPAVEEVREHVKAFEIADVSAEHAGRAVEAIALTIRLCPPERLDTVPTRALTDQSIGAIRELKDASPYGVRAETIVRVGSSLPSSLLARKKRGGAHPLLQSEMHRLYDFWLVAIREALTGEAVTPAFETGAYRGQRLLDAIARHGADETFFRFAHAEAAGPDLRPVLLEIPGLAMIRKADDARKARLAEARAQAARERRVEVRNARADGMLPPPKKRSTDSLPMPAPTPVQAPVAAPEGPPPPVPAELMEALKSPEGRAEAKRLYHEWQSAFEFPFSQASKAAVRIREALRGGEFPIIGAVDRAIGDVYVESMKPIVLMTRERIPGTSLADQEDNAAHTVAMLARAWLVSAMNGRSSDPYAEQMRNREIWLRDRKAAIARVTEQRAMAKSKPVSEPERYRDGYTPKRAFPA